MGALDTFFRNAWNAQRPHRHQRDLSAAVQRTEPPHPGIAGLKVPPPPLPLMAPGPQGHAGGRGMARSLGMYGRGPEMQGQGQVGTGSVVDEH